ncbi:MAG TPA: hypothetical protein VLA93_00265, partial [Pyrinomonadaceae bacterium]|nr:hypothetical protein [Pyrinomonadaceae bacterium]
MKKFYAGGAGLIIIGVVIALIVYRSNTREEELHYEREETRFFLANLSGANVNLYKAGRNLEDSVIMPDFKSDGMWLPRGNYFLKVEQGDKTSFYPVPIFSYRSGPDKEGT